MATKKSESKKADTKKADSSIKALTVKIGDKVKIDYEGKLDDGTVFDSSENHGKPLEFKLGSNQVIPGFENAIIGMKKGDKKTINIKPEEAYGSNNPDLIKKIPREDLPEQELKPGMMLMMRLPNGAQFPATIVEVMDNEVSVDFNHPLAGKNLTFEIELVEIG